MSIILRFVFWTEGSGKKARLMLGDMENKNYKVLVAAPLIDEPDLLAFSETDGYLYFTDKSDEKAVKRLKPSVGR